MLLRSKQTTSSFDVLQFVFLAMTRGLCCSRPHLSVSLWRGSVQMRRAPLPSALHHHKHSPVSGGFQGKYGKRVGYF